MLGNNMVKKSLITQIRQFLHKEATLRGFIKLFKIHNHKNQSGIGQTRATICMSTFI